MESRELNMTFIGVGNMGEALLGGVLRSRITTKERAVIHDVNPKRLRKVSAEFDVQAEEDMPTAVRGADVILLAVKPQNLPEISEQLKGKLEPNQLVISVLAGVPVARLKEALGEEPCIVRVMPNLPAVIGAGMSVVANDVDDQEHVKLVCRILETVGEVIALPEKHLDAVTALSGSGPGFVCLFIEALSDAGEAIGLPAEAAKQMARKTFIGACQLLEVSGQLPEELRLKVTSPAGTTEAGLKVFEELGLRGIFKAALERATQRAKELGRGEI